MYSASILSCRLRCYQLLHAAGLIMMEWSAKGPCLCVHALCEMHINPPLHRLHLQLLFVPSKCRGLPAKKGGNSCCWRLPCTPAASMPPCLRPNVNNRSVRKQAREPGSRSMCPSHTHAHMCK